MEAPLSPQNPQLSAAKQALLAQRLQGRAQSSRPTIPRRSPATAVPLSFSQKRLWFLYQFEPDNPFYNVPFALHLQGTLDNSALQQTLQTVVQRHEILRTTFAETNEKLIGTAQAQQIIHPKSDITLQLIDLSPQGDRAWAAVEPLARAEAQQTFDLHQGPLLRATLLRISDQEFVLLVTLHHIISDVWSTGVLVREMVTLYSAFSQGKPNPLPPLPIQYADFTLWQRRSLQGQHLQTQREYWQQQFATLPPVLQLPTDRPRPAVQSFRGDRGEFSLSVELTAALKRLGQAHEATLFMTLLAAFKVLLHRYTGQTDLTIGSAIANRNQAELEGLVGLFMNTLALRTDLAGNPSFQELLGRVREVALGAYSHQDLPFEQLIEGLKLPRELSHTPLFQVMVILQNAPSPALTLPGLTLKPLELAHTTAKFDLTLIAAEVAGGLQGTLEYNTDLFDKATIERLLGHFQMLLAGLVANPEARLSEISLLTPAESAQLQEWRQPTGQPFPSACLHQLFEAQVEKTPGAIAIIDGHQQLTYAELNQRANQLARHLQSLGVEPEVLVGLCVERTLDMVIGILGILKAGGAYVPLDPSYPPSRLQFMVGDAQLSVLLTQSQLLADLPALDAAIVCVDRDWPTIAQAPSANLSTGVTANNLAYIIYTSGSTGTPKGVMIPHQNVVRLFKTTEPLYRFNEQDCWTLFHSYAFDFSVWELWGPLLYGGRLVVVPYWVSRSPQEFYTLLVEQQVTVLNQTPSAFSQLIQIDADYSPEALKLRYVIFGGEALAVESLRPWFDRHGDTQPQLVNMYGITETTVHVTHRPLSIADLAQSSSPIGQPLVDLYSTILDSHLQPVPIGIPGELHIGGAGVARGYLNRPELTAQRFIPNPFLPSPASPTPPAPLLPPTLYKTGDLVRYRPDGSLEYLGRIDHQVKIRGFRIELGEIEAALQQHPHVREGVVMVRTDPPGQHRLVAYLTRQPSGEGDGAAPDTAQQDLRQWLQTRLPDYMVPSAFVWLAQLPLNANGKIDRSQLQTLPVPTLVRTDMAAPFVAPRSPIEQQLATIWASVLGVATVGIDDNFFELGGDSILSLQVITQAHQAGLQLSVKQLFQHQTIRALSTAVEPIAIATVTPEPTPGTVVLTPVQRRILTPSPADHSWEYPSLALTLRQPLTLEALQAIVHHLLNHHDALRISFQQQGTTWTQYNPPPIASPDHLPPGVVAQLTHTNADAHQAIADAITQCQATLDPATGPSTGPLIRVVLLHPAQEGQSQILLWVAHPLVMDTPSWPILLADFQTLWHQRLRGKPLQLPAKTVSFQQWAKQCQSLSPSTDAPLPVDFPGAPLPVDFPEGEAVAASRQTLTVSLNRSETQPLLQQVPAVYHSNVEAILLTALTQTYAHWTGQSQLGVDRVVDGRHYQANELAVARTVGEFTTLHPVMLDLSSTIHPGDAIKAIKEQLRRMPTQGLDYGGYPPLSQPQQNQDGAEKQPSWPSIDLCFSHADSLDLECLDLNCQADADASLTAMATGFESAQRQRYPWPHKLCIESRVVAGRLQMRWTYHRTLHRQDTIDTLAQSCLQNLRSLIDHCLSPDAGGYTPTDFPLAQLDQATLDRLVTRYPQIEDCYPLTPIQQGFLFHALYDPDDGMYVTQLCCRLQGPLNVAALKQTWQLIGDRHSILRTAFVWEDLPEPLQVVQRQAVMPWQQQDWRSRSAAAQQAERVALLQRDRSAGFQPQVAPLMRLTLIQMADDSYEIIWSCHHMLLDGWSMPMVIQELFTLYDGIRQEQMPELAPRRPYRDYLAWLSSQDLSTAATFWTDLLQGFRSPTPLGYQRSQDMPPHHEIQGLTLSSATATAMQALAQRHHITLNTLIQGVWSMLLSHISGQADVVFGATTAGRPPTLAGADTMVGLFINTLPVRVQLRPDIAIAAWLQTLQAQRGEARQYEYSPLNQIQRWSEVPAGTPLFESLIVFENYRVEPLATALQTGLTIQSVDTVRNNNYPLTLRVLPREDFVLQIMGDRTCFAAETTQRWLHHLDALLQWVVDHPEAPLGDWQAHLSDLDRQWQQQQAQALTQTRLQKLRKTRRKTVRANPQ